MTSNEIQKVNENAREMVRVQMKGMIDEFIMTRDLHIEMQKHHGEMTLLYTEKLEKLRARAERDGIDLDS